MDISTLENFFILMGMKYAIGLTVIRIKKTLTANS